ncbi:MAG TPA: hypothetical protein VGU43_04600 [Thermoplasmata archaeon]|nr:hypothetical protein [Thermoplasmata archaeon]
MSADPEPGAISTFLDISTHETTEGGLHVYSLGEKLARNRADRSLRLSGLVLSVNFLLVFVVGVATLYLGLPPGNENWGALYNLALGAAVGWAVSAWAAWMVFWRGRPDA